MLQKTSILRGLIDIYYISVFHQQPEIRRPPCQPPAIIPGISGFVHAGSNLPQGIALRIQSLAPGQKIRQFLQCINMVCLIGNPRLPHQPGRRPKTIALSRQIRHRSHSVCPAFHHGSLCQRYPLRQKPLNIPAMGLQKTVHRLQHPSAHISSDILAAQHHQINPFVFADPKRIFRKSIRCVRQSEYDFCADFLSCDIVHGSGYQIQILQHAGGQSLISHH